MNVLLLTCGLLLATVLLSPYAAAQQYYGESTPTTTTTDPTVLCEGCPEPVSPQAILVQKYAHSTVAEIARLINHTDLYLLNIAEVTQQEEPRMLLDYTLDVAYFEDVPCDSVVIRRNRCSAEVQLSTVPGFSSLVMSTNLKWCSVINEICPECPVAADQNDQKIQKFAHDALMEIGTLMNRTDLYLTEIIQATKQVLDRVILDYLLEVAYIDDGPNNSLTIKREICSVDVEMRKPSCSEEITVNWCSPVSE